MPRRREEEERLSMQCVSLQGRTPEARLHLRRDDDSATSTYHHDGKNHLYLHLLPLLPPPTWMVLTPLPPINAWWAMQIHLDKTVTLCGDILHSEISLDRRSTMPCRLNLRNQLSFLTYFKKVAGRKSKLPLMKGIDSLRRVSQLYHSVLVERKRTLRRRWINLCGLWFV